MVPKLSFRFCVASLKLAMKGGLTAKEQAQKGKNTLGMAITQDALWGGRINMKVSRIQCSVLIATLLAADRCTEWRVSLPLSLLLLLLLLKGNGPWKFIGDWCAISFSLGVST